MKKLLATLSILVAFGIAAPGSPGLDWIATSKGGCVVMPPTAITDGMVARVSWSPSGENLLVVERPNGVTQEQVLSGMSSAPGTLHVLGWDRQFQRIRTLWSSEDSTAKVDGIGWLRGTTAALITLQWVTQTGPKNESRTLYGVVWIDASSGNFKWIPGLEQLVARPHVFPSPSKPLAAVVFGENLEAEAVSLPQNLVVTSDGDATSGTIELRIVEAVDASLSEWFSSASLNQAIKANNYWTVDGLGAVRHVIKVDKPLELPLVWAKEGSAWFLKETDPNTKKPALCRLTDQGKLETTDEEEFVTPTRSASLVTERKPGQTELGKSKVTFESLWLESATLSEHRELCLTPNGTWPELSPTDGAVFYIDGGVAKVRALIALSKDQLSALRSAIKQQESAEASEADIKLLNRVYFTISHAKGADKPVPN